ncbi:TPA: Gfo/Idh/MocA family oxidoreductase [Candidatus Poribacteria bacterium]|nr:Gfo/Idh/MocA family oxidoreductase [Candidatus Poribacteria bacterium]
MKIGFIGAGGIASNYLGSLDKIEDAQVTAICDLIEERAEIAAKPRGAKVYTKHAEMLEKEELDVVFTCIPPGAHTTQVADSAEVAKAVFVAKPVALDLDTALRTSDVIEKRGIINQVGYMARYSDITEKAKELIGSRELHMGCGRFMGRAGPGHPWWGKFEMSGGQMLEQSTHVFDLLRYFMGDVESVLAFGKKGIYFADFDECTTCNLKFSSGAVGNVTSTCVARVEGGFATELVGNDLYLKLQHDTKLQGNIEGNAIDYDGKESGYLRQIELFIEAVKTGNQEMVRTDYADGVKTLAVTIAANKSIESGKIESVPKTE